MLRWSKFQYQSRDLKKSIIFGIFLLVIISFPQVFAQDEKKPYDWWMPVEEREYAMEKGVLIEQQDIIFEIKKDSTIHVKHVIENGAWDMGNSPRLLEILPGSHTNLIVFDEDGDRIAYGVVGETFEESKYVVLKQKLAGLDVVVEYDLKNFLIIKDNLWFKEINFPFDIQMKFPEYMKNIFVNSRPIDISDASGINCIGCQMMLELTVD